MELKNLQQYWESFPELSMEERPVLSSDLEKIVVRNPLSDAFYLKNRIIVRIGAAGFLLLYNIYQLRQEYIYDGPDLDREIVLFIALGYFLYFHIRLLVYADYPALLALRLMPFLQKIETILDKYILSFGVVSILSGIYTLLALEKVLALSKSGDLLTGNGGLYKWLIIIFLAISYYIGFLHTIIPKYRKLLQAVRKYKSGITTRPQKK